MNGLHPAEQAARSAAERRDIELAREPERRRAHGIVHTPPELARGTLAILDELLVTRLDVELGVSDPSVHLIDPACGPGAFIAAALRLWAARGSAEGMRLSGIDIDPAALAHAAELASHAPRGFALHQADALRDDVLPALAASEPRVIAIAGNPPWATARTDKTPQMQALLEDFRCDAAGVRLPERKLGVLSDAYVRFFRVCAEVARTSERGSVVALITNGSFLDGPVHRGMRAALMRWFDEIYVLDLGGSALLSRAREPGAVRDENVFGVRPSVTISWLCRKPGGGAAREAAVYYARLSGSALHKREALAAATLESLGFAHIEPERPLSRFVPRPKVHATYASWPSLADWMPFHREGVQTNRDRLTVDADRTRLLMRLGAFARGERVSELVTDDQPHFDLSGARRNVARALERDPEGRLGVAVRRLAYRPFDVRWFSPVAALCHRPRPELARALDHAGEVLVSVRKDRGDSPYAHFGAAAFTIDNCLLSARSSCRSRAFPVRTPDGADNLSETLRAECEARLGVSLDAATFARYALAHLAAGAYRTRYDAELHSDYPRIPPPCSVEALQALATCGARIWTLWAEPIDSPPSAAGLDELAPIAALTCGQLRFDPRAGELRAGKQRIASYDPALLATRLGHHDPWKLYLAAHASEQLTASHLAQLAALADRLQRLRDLAIDADSWLRRLGNV